MATPMEMVSVNANRIFPSQRVQKSGMDAIMSAYRHLDPFASQEFHGHTGYVWGCAMTSDNAFAFSGSDDKLIKIWNASTGDFIDNLVGHTDCAYFLVMTSDDANLVSAGWDHQIIIWDWRERVIQSTITGHSNEVFNILLTPDDKYLVSGSRDCTVVVWNFASRSKIAEFQYGNSVFGIVMTKDSSVVLAAGFDETIKKYSLDSKKELIKYTPGIGPLQCLALTPDNKFLIFGSRSGIMKVWNYPEATEYCTYTGHENSLRNLSCTSDSNYVISSSLDKTLRIFNIKKKVEEVKLEGCGGWIYGQFLSKDGQYLLAASTDKVMRMWKIGDKYRVKTIKGHPLAIASVAVSKDSRYIVTASDTIVRKWSIEDSKLLIEYSGHSDALWAVGITGDMRYIASGGADKNLNLWDFDSKKLVKSFTGHTNTIFALASNTESSILASASGDMMIILWDLINLNEMKKLEGHTDTIFALTFTYSGTTLISGAGDYTIRVWDMTELGTSIKIEAHTGMIESISLNKDETILALGCRDKCVHLWDWKTKKPIKKFADRHTNVVKTVKFFSSSNTLMSASLDCTVRLWNADEERHDFALNGHTLPVRSADITADGRYVISASNDCTIKVWDLESVGELELNDVGGPMDSFLYMTKLKKKVHPQDINYNAMFSPLKINVAHIYAYLGYDELLVQALKIGTEIKIDNNQCSPLFYALERRTQGCIDAILEYITGLKDKNFENFLNYSYALKGDLEALLNNSSSKLPDFLEGIFYKVPNIANFAVPKYSLPHLHYCHEKNIATHNFILLPEEASENDTELPIEFKALPFAIYQQKGSKGSLELLKSIASCPNQQILRTDFVITYIRNKWNDLWGFILLITLLMWINLALMTIALISYTQVDTSTAFYNSILIAFGIVNVVLTLYELAQMLSMGFGYFFDFYNIVDCVRISISYCWIGLSLYYPVSTLRYLGWCMAIVNYFRGLSGFKAFDNTRYYTRLITRATTDSIPFLLVFFYSTLAFGVIYLASSPSLDSPIANLWTISYELNMGGFSNAGYDSLEYACFMLASIVNVIIILNLLISILGNSFDSFQAESQEIDCLEMVDLVIEIETLMTCRRKSNEKRYMQKCQDLASELKGNWEGRIKTILTSIKVLKKDTHDKYEALLKKDEETQKLINTKFSEISNKLDAVLAKN